MFNNWYPEMFPPEDHCKWLISLTGRSSQTSLQLFCFPYAGGNASTFLPWRKYLPANVELIVIQPPGRGTHLGAPLIHNMNDLIKEVAPRIKRHISMPFIFFGHSLGARMAFETMDWLLNDGGFLPQHFIASGSCAPDVIHGKAHTYTLCDEEFIEELVKLGGTPKEVFEHPDILSFFLPTLRADFEVAGRYVYNGSAIFDCPVSIFSGINDHEIPRGDLERWYKFFAGDPDVTLFEGNHFFIESTMKNVLEKINNIILAIGVSNDASILTDNLLV